MRLLVFVGNRSQWNSFTGIARIYRTFFLLELLYRITHLPIMSVTPDDDDIVNINSTIHSLVILAADSDYHESLMNMPCTIVFGST